MSLCAKEFGYVGSYRDVEGALHMGETQSGLAVGWEGVPEGRNQLGDD